MHYLAGRSLSVETFENGDGSIASARNHLTRGFENETVALGQSRPDRAKNVAKLFACETQGCARQLHDTDDTPFPRIGEGAVSEPVSQDGLEHIADDRYAAAALHFGNQGTETVAFYRDLRSSFAEDSPPIRGRFLCPELQAACGFAAPDLELRVGAWASLKPPADAKIVICENKANFLSLPMLPRTLAFWGQGGSVSGNLPKLAWLAAFRVIYWGDMDPSGFAILAQLRSKLPHVESVLMDLATLTTNADQIGEAKPAQGAVQVSFLTTEETEAFAQVSSPPRGLEQEKLLFRDGLMAVRSKLF